MDDRHYFDPRRAPPPSTSAGSSNHRVSNGDLPSPVHYRDHSSYHRSNVVHRAWEDDRAPPLPPPPLPLLSGNGSHHHHHHHLHASPSNLSRVGPPPPPPSRQYDYDHRQARYDEERLREYETRVPNHSFRDEFDDQDRYQESRDVSVQIVSCVKRRL